MFYTDYQTVAECMYVCTLSARYCHLGIGSVQNCCVRGAIGEREGEKRVAPNDGTGWLWRIGLCTWMYVGSANSVQIVQIVQVVQIV